MFKDKIKQRSIINSGCSDENRGIIKSAIQLATSALM
jgi:hypothetical protein